MTESSSRGKTVLVTGGAGYIGSHAVLELVDRDWPAVVLDNLVTGFRWAVPPGVPFVEGDIADARLVERIINDHDVGAILHFAGSINVRESTADPLKYYLNNSANSFSLIKTAIVCGVRHFVFSSTAAVYGDPDTVPVAEMAPTRPISPYGKSKLMTEIALADIAQAHGINYAALRYFNVAGADAIGRAGQSSAVATHIVKVAVQAVVGKRHHVEVFGDDYDTPDGTGVRDYIHVSDLASAHVLMLEKLIEDPIHSHVLNCGYGRGFSVTEVLDTVEQVANARLERRVVGRRPGDPAALVADATLIRSLPEWSPRYDDLVQIVTHALAWEVELLDKETARLSQPGLGCTLL